MTCPAEGATGFEPPNLPFPALDSRAPQLSSFQPKLNLPAFTNFPESKFSDNFAEPLPSSAAVNQPPGRLAQSGFLDFSCLPRKGSRQESSGSGSFDPSRSSLIASNSMLPTPEALHSVQDGHLLDTAPSSSKVQPGRLGREVHQRGASSSRSSAEEADHNQQVSVSQPSLSPEDLQDALETGSDKLTDKMKRRLYLKEDPNYPNLSEKDRRRIRRRIANRESARRVRQKREDQLSDAQKQAMAYKAETVRLRQYVVKLEEQGRLLAKEAMHWRTKFTQSNYQSMQMYNELSTSSRGGNEGQPGSSGPHPLMALASQGMPGGAPNQQPQWARMPKTQPPSPNPINPMASQASAVQAQHRHARASPYQPGPDGYDMNRSQPLHPRDMGPPNPSMPGHNFDTAPLDIRMPSFGGSLSALDRLLWPALTESAEGDGHLNGFADQ